MHKRTKFKWKRLYIIIGTVAVLSFTFFNERDISIVALSSMMRPGERDEIRTPAGFSTSLIARSNTISTFLKYGYPTIHSRRLIIHETTKDTRTVVIRENQDGGGPSSPTTSPWRHSRSPSKIAGVPPLPHRVKSQRCCVRVLDRARLPLQH